MVSLGEGSLMVYQKDSEEVDRGRSGEDLVVFLLKQIGCMVIPSRDYCGPGQDRAPRLAGRDGFMATLDLRAPVFSVKEAIDGNGNQVLVCKRIEKGTCGVTHFATCSHANEFSRNRKAKP